ncbi:MAG: uL30 family ribosomal protein [Candidatus Anstonellales archaeon]
MIAAVRIRGVRNMLPQIKATLEMLNLGKTNYCVLLKDDPSTNGMLLKAKDYIAYGPISPEVAEKLIRAKGEFNGKKLSMLPKEKADEIVKKVLALEFPEGFKKAFRCRPPSKGYKDIKKQWPAGDLGKRPSMDSLIRRMI